MPSPSDVLQHAQLNNMNVLLVVPSFLQEWARSMDAIDYLKTMESVVSLDLPTYWQQFCLNMAFRFFGGEFCFQHLVSSLLMLVFSSARYIAVQKLGP